MNALRSAFLTSARLGLACLAIALAAGCVGPADGADSLQPDARFAASGETSLRLGIQTWHSYDRGAATQLQGLGRDGSVLADLTITSAGITGGPVELLVAQPEPAAVRLLPDGSIEGHAPDAIRALIDAVYADLKQPRPIAFEPAGKPGVELVQKPLTTDGSFHFNSNLFGHNETRIVGPDPCPGGESRTGQYVRGRKRASRCSFDGWRTNSATDCRIYVEANIPSLTSEDCDWEITSN
jgi:hypothetical protein